ncbi:MAG: endolytic transglycosylase MltG [Elusimicrobia bacterium]|nr:endolytic transglycosylase MltG [Elusimicrobiota bacterium]
MKNKKWIFSSLLILALALCLIGWLRLPKTPVTLRIALGSSSHEIARILKKEGLIESERLFILISKITNSSKRFKAGVYVISPRTSIFKIINMLAEGKSRFYKVTIPEGFTSAQIAGLLYSDGIIDKEKFLSIVKEKKLEGYLFPQTYFFDPRLSEEKIIEIMFREFNRNYTDDFKKRAKELKMSDQQIVTLASIIEREAYHSEERPKISAVFHNRLKKRWYLESCATVLYALGKHKEKLLNKDLKVKSPYNTYLNMGLPPGPISNPGLDSIKAALYPESTNEMFFVVGSSGTHIFSRYMNEHIKNKRMMKNARKNNLSRP